MTQLRKTALIVLSLVAINIVVFGSIIVFFRTAKAEYTAVDTVTNLGEIQVVAERIPLTAALKDGAPVSLGTILIEANRIENSQAVQTGDPIQLGEILVEAERPALLAR